MLRTTRTEDIVIPYDLGLLSVVYPFVTCRVITVWLCSSSCVLATAIYVLLRRPKSIYVK